MSADGELMRAVNRIVVHCSDSDFGDKRSIDQWHRQRGWSGVGYHFIILNAYPDAESLRLRQPHWWRDGVVESGRPLALPGAHLKGHNSDSIGICLIGREVFTGAQLMALERLLVELRGRFPAASVAGHYEFQPIPPKSCPNLDMDWVRSRLSL